MDYTKTITEPQSSVIADFSLAGPNPLVAGSIPATPAREKSTITEL
ncbi:MAG TPA: hypothetical protein GX520_05600 [Syntrophaceticus sp.]|nr:hypothetical protein [Syntrophaceticus sp.]